MKVKEQPEINIGIIGHVDHGKTTLTQALTGEWTDRHSEELKRGISIKLGYADTAFYKCPDCDEPECYTIHEECPHCGGKTQFQRAVSFVDSPGHETLMATMLSGAAIMNGALLLIAANEKCPQPQTREHLMALAISGVRNIIVVQNKIDIVDEKRLRSSYEEIKEFLKGTLAEESPIIPVSAHHDVNLDIIIHQIEKRMPTPGHDLSKSPRMFVARSFDVNTPGNRPKDLRGGVVGGTLIQGQLRVGDEIEISPGRLAEGKTAEWETIRSQITSLYTGGKSHKTVKPGGLISIGTNLDPYFTKSDSLTGRMAGAPDTLPDILNKITMEVHLLEKVIGSDRDLKVDHIKSNEPLMLSIGTSTTVGIVKSAREKKADVNLKIPVCAEAGQRAAISRRIGGKWRLIGYGIIE